MTGGKSLVRSSGRARGPCVSLKTGYGRPPIEHRFKPGQSGNPRGRPKGKKNEATILHELLNRKITVRGHTDEFPAHPTVKPVAMVADASRPPSIASTPAKAATRKDGRRARKATG
jgi:Family of unknown function (DUF5681)